MHIYRNFNLKEHNTFHVDAKAAYFTEIQDFNEIAQAVGFANEKGIPILILGGGSNLLFTRDFEGLVIKIRITGYDIVKEDDEHVWIRIGAGEEWHQVVIRCVESGFGGIENLSLIPGTVGAAPMQNIGAYGVELKEVFDSLEAYEIATGKIKKFFLNDCGFGYRMSVFKNKFVGKYIIAQVTLALRKKQIYNTTYSALQNAIEMMGVKELSLKSISDTVISVRQSKLPDPNVIGNAGSFFKNPTIGADEYERLKNLYPALPGYPDRQDKVKISSAWLIEQCGWKGKRINDAGVHEKHALILVNHGNATGKEIKQLEEMIRQDVVEKFGIGLEPEVNIV
jgi:UDP-N-acetylmuramate dehydrogenase